MRTTVVLDNELVDRAMEVTGIRERSALLREALQTLVQSEAARRLILLGGSDPQATAGPRRRHEGQWEE
jgi:Arc/MetJ family transcription regulator